ncbi:MAG: T9SS type A sorting domain-containing protein [Candidatus Azobacteroides sp.]|nr:T9SS type A sorting domain-containing protein [Candidatus Azobacteroides sp.]
MKTKLLLLAVFTFSISNLIKSQPVVENWENAFAEENQGDKGLGTWLKTTYLWGYVDDATEENKGFYTLGNEKNDTTLHANPLLKGVDDIMWTLKRSYDYYMKLDADNDGRNLIRARKNVTLESNIISGGIEWITVDMNNVAGAVLRITLISAADSKVNLSYDFTPVEADVKQIKLETAGTAFEDVDEFIIRAAFAGDSYFNLFTISYLPKEGTQTDIRQPELQKPELRNNPAEILLSGIPQENATLCIFNALGQKIYTQSVNSSEVIIPKKQFAKDIYIVTLTSSTGEWSYKVSF